MVGAGLLSATAKACAWNVRPETLKSGAACVAVRAEDLFNNPDIFHAARASADRGVKAEQQSSPRRMCKKPFARNIFTLSIKVMR
jgi:hypothetical protein